MACSPPTCPPAEKGEHDICARVSGQALLLWQGLVQPLFFALTGAALDFGSIAHDVAPKAIGIVAVGMAGRVAATLACLHMGLPSSPPSQQRMFAALALLSKVSSTIPDTQAKVGNFHDLCSAPPSYCLLMPPEGSPLLLHTTAAIVAAHPFSCAQLPCQLPVKSVPPCF